MSDPGNTHALSRRLAGSFLLVSLVSLTVLLVGRFKIRPKAPFSSCWIISTTER